MGLTLLCSFKLEDIFDQGDNNREIAQLNENKKNSINFANPGPKTFCNLSSWVNDIARGGLAKLAKPR